MPRTQGRKTNTRKVNRSALETRIKDSALKSSDLGLAQKLQSELKNNQSYLSLVLGLLIVLVAGILVFSYLKKGNSSLGPAQQTAETQIQTEAVKDVEPGNLPGKYTVKEGDTLFNIAQNYYKDGYKYSKIAENNKLTNPDIIEVGQVLEIPNITETNLATKGTTELGTGGAVNQTIWGEAISGDTYTVAEGDWLSKIAGRAYGDIMAFDKIAKANNISDPNIIEPGTVLKLPR